MKKYDKIFFVLVLLCAFANKPQAQSGIYLKMTGITGDVTMPPAYANFIQVTSYQGGAGKAVSSGGTPTFPTISEITLTLPLGSASLPLLNSLLNSSTAISSADFYFVGAGCTCPYYRVHLETVIVTGFSESSGGEVPTNTVSLHFSKIAWAYYKANSTTITNTTGYDLTTNKAYTYSFP